jgi:hypothetical protein
MLHVEAVQAFRASGDALLVGAGYGYRFVVHMLAPGAAGASFDLEPARSCDGARPTAGVLSHVRQAEDRVRC